MNLPRGHVAFATEKETFILSGFPARLALLLAGKVTCIWGQNRLSRLRRQPLKEGACATDGARAVFFQSPGCCRPHSRTIRNTCLFRFCFHSFRLLLYNVFLCYLLSVFKFLKLLVAKTFRRPGEMYTAYFSQRFLRLGELWHPVQALNVNGYDKQTLL